MNTYYKVNNAIIMAAGLSSRFAPLSYEYPKALLRVKGEVLIERQIRQLQEAGIEDITIVVGYKKELFHYLIDLFKVKIVENPEYHTRNNNSTLYYVKHMLRNTYICSADNYFSENVFEAYVDHAYYSAVFEEGKTKEWCISADEKGLITDVKVGGEHSWIMLGHAFFSDTFSKKFVAILESIYELPETAPLLWESIYIRYIHELKMYIRKYSKETIFEFDTLDELREFDSTYYANSDSQILRKVSERLNCKEEDIVSTKPIYSKEEVVGFEFLLNGRHYTYDYQTKQLSEVGADDK
jgi:CTP:phosphocholine cytidylyltransferase-like protein